MFDKLKELYQFQKKAKAIQKELSNIEIEAEALEGKVKVVFSGEQKIRSVSIDSEVLEPSKKAEVERAIENAVREAVAKSQQIAAEKMKDITGNLNIPGMS